METPEKDGPSGLMSDAEHLRIFLHERNVNCPLCGYNLRNQTQGRCPECGRELKLTVGLTEPYLRAWIALAVVTFGTAGIGLLFLVSILRERWPRGAPFLVSIAFCIFLSGPLQAAATVFWRRGLLRLPTSAQWKIVWLAAAIDSAAIGLLFIAG